MTRPDELTKQLEMQGRYVLAAPLCEDQRLLDLGGASVAGLVALAQVGPAQVAVCGDRGPQCLHDLEEAGMEGAEEVFLHSDADGPHLQCGDSSFDIIICHDLPERLHEDPRWAAEVRRVLAPQGTLMTAVANPQGDFISEIAGNRPPFTMDYQSVVDALGPLFGAMSTFGQSPLCGSLFFDFADTSEDSGLSLDRALLPDDSEQPGWYVLLFGPEHHRDDLAIVQLPFKDLVQAALERGTSYVGAVDLQDDSSAHRELAEAQAKVQQMQHEQATAEVYITDLQQQIETLRNEPTTDWSAQAVVDADEIKTLRIELETFKEQLQAANRLNDSLQQELEELTSRLSQTGTNAVALRPRDAVGRELDSAVEELEDLLKELSPSGR